MGDSDRLSHFLAKLLRHEARSRGLNVTPEGYVDIGDILSQPEARRFTESDVQRIVDKDRKGRFKIRTHCGITQIKATQAHSMKLENPVAEMTPINHFTEARVVLHGTQRKNWPYIKVQGLSRRNRTHIHFAQGERVKSEVQKQFYRNSPSPDQTICCSQKTQVLAQKTGFPPNCDMVIEIDLELALKGGLKFYKSENDVILCPGNGAGVIPSKYFKRVYDRLTHETID